MAVTDRDQVKAGGMGRGKRLCCGKASISWVQWWGMPGAWLRCFFGVLQLCSGKWQCLAAQFAFSTCDRESRGFCKLLEVTKWLSQAHYPGLDHQGAAGTILAIRAILSQVGWSWSPFIFSSMKRTWWLVFSRLNVMIYLRHRHRDDWCITSPHGET